MKGEGERLLIDLLINNIFSKLVLPLNFKTAKEGCYENFEVDSS